MSIRNLSLRPTRSVRFSVEDFCVSINKANPRRHRIYSNYNLGFNASPNGLSVDSFSQLPKANENRAVMLDESIRLSALVANRQFRAVCGGDTVFFSNLLAKGFQDGEDGGLDERVPISVGFEQDDWETVRRVSQWIARNPDRIYGPENPYKIGDKKEVLLGVESHLVEILGFNHDEKADGTGKAGITIGMCGLTDSVYVINQPASNQGGWTNSRIRTHYVPWFMDNMDIHLRNCIVPVLKQTTGGSQSRELVLSADTLFLFSQFEVTGLVDVAGPVQEGEQYEIWRSVRNGAINADRIKRSNLHGADGWWFRSPRVTDSVSYRRITAAGALGQASSAIGQTICFGFCV